MSKSCPSTTSFNLCTPQAVQLLEQALQYCQKWDKEHGEVNSMNYYAHPTLKQEKDDDGGDDHNDNHNYSPSNHDDDDDDDASHHSNNDGSTTSRSSNEDDNNEEENKDEKDLTTSIDKLTMEAQQQQTRTNKQQSKSKKYQSIQSLVQQIGSPPTIAFPLLTTNNQEVHVPSAFFTKHELRDTPTSKCTRLLTLARSSSEQQNVAILLLQSGRFTGAIFDSQQQKCVVHTTFTKYTQRKKQGKSQSSMDNSKGKANSMGAQLRRAGEVALQQDVQTTLETWKTPYLDSCSVVWVSCPPTMMKQHITDHLSISAKDRVRKVPLNYGKPTFESACAIYQIMMQLHLVHVAVDTTTTNVPTITKDQDETTTTTKNQHSPQQRSSTINTIQEEQDEDTLPPPPLTPLHVAAAEGNVDMLKELLSNSSDKDDINACAGPEYRTPLHYAAANDASTNNTNNNNINAAAECVSLLLLVGHANPSIVDVRNRVPYYDASHETIRNAFRLARYELGEEYLEMNWDVDAKVGPPLSNEDLQQRNKKALEKKKRQRARQKEKKKLEQQKIAQEKLAKETLAQKQLADQEAKRIRDALPPSSKLTNKTASMVCDFCQTPQKGKRRSQMFERLGYRYCSTECVQKHKRELMAKAAMERFN